MKYSKEWLTESEVRKLFSNPQINSRDLLLMKVTYYGGLRIGETLKSVREDYRIDPHPHLLLRDQKTDKKNWELQPIPPEIIGDISRFCKNNNIKTQDAVFQSNRNKRMSYNNAYKLVKKWVKESGINKDITTHSFRRSRAVHLLNSGTMDIYKVSQFLRHKGIESTQHYLKISKKQLFDYMEKTDKDQLLSIYNTNV